MGFDLGEGEERKRICVQYLNKTQVHQDLRHPRFVGTKYKSPVRYILPIGCKVATTILANPDNSYIGSFSEL